MEEKQEAELLECLGEKGEPLTWGDVKAFARRKHVSDDAIVTIEPFGAGPDSQEGDVILGVYEDPDAPNVFLFMYGTDEE